MCGSGGKEWDGDNRDTGVMIDGFTWEHFPHDTAEAAADDDSAQCLRCHWLIRTKRLHTSPFHLNVLRSICLLRGFFPAFLLKKKEEEVISQKSRPLSQHAF